MLHFSQEQYPRNAFCLHLYMSLKVKSCHARWLFKKHDYKKLLKSTEDNMFSAQK